MKLESAGMRRAWARGAWKIKHLFGKAVTEICPINMDDEPGEGRRDKKSGLAVSHETCADVHAAVKTRWEV